MIMNSPSEEYPARFKVTLANFRSYCQKNSKSAARLSAENTFNTTMTRYRSIRQVKLLDTKHDFYSKSPPKRPHEHAQLKTEEQSLPLKSSDLIEMIKIKLKDSDPKNKKVKTEANPKEESLHHRYSKKGVEMAAYLLKSVKFGRNPRKKKLDLTVTHTKCDLLPRQDKPQRYKEIIVALRSRPCSAIAYRATQGSFPEEQNIDYKFSSPEVQHQLSREPKYQRKSTECSKTKELSGWEIPTFEESFFDNQMTQEGKLAGKKKRKLKRRS